VVEYDPSKFNELLKTNVLSAVRCVLCYDFGWLFVLLVLSASADFSLLLTEC
jgi:hypothetical protein